MASRKAQVLLSLAVLAVCQSFFSAAFAQSTGNIFRYTDRNGRIVFNSHIPSEYAGNGYTILNARGQVLEVIPRAKTKAEIAAQEAALAAAQAEAEAKQEQEEADQLLIRLYRSPDEIDRKRDNTLGPINAQIGLLVNNLAKANQAMTEAQTVVDNYIKASKEAPPDIVAKATRAKNEITGLESKLTILQADRTRIMADAERDSSRLRQLLGSAEQSITQ